MTDGREIHDSYSLGRKPRSQGLSYHLFEVKLSDRCFCWFPAAMLEPIRMGSWRLQTYTALYKFEWNISPHILLKKNCCDLILGEGLCIFAFFLFPDSWLYLLNGFDFYFDLFWMTLKTSNISIGIVKTPYWLLVYIYRKLLAGDRFSLWQDLRVPHCPRQDLQLTDA